MKQVTRKLLGTGAIVLTLIGGAGVAAAQVAENHAVITSGEGNTQRQLDRMEPYGGFTGYYNYVEPQGGVYVDSGRPIYNYGGPAYDYRYEPGPSVGFGVYLGR